MVVKKKVTKKTKLKKYMERIEEKKEKIFC